MTEIMYYIRFAARTLASLILGLLLLPAVLFYVPLRFVFRNIGLELNVNLRIGNSITFYVRTSQKP